MIRDCAHGKVILFGEHAVVYGRLALAVPIREAVVLDHLQELARGVLIRVEPWGLHASDTDPGPVGEALRILSRFFPGEAGFEARVTARIPAGVGLGSSAALAAVLVRALAWVRGLQADDDVVRAGVHAMERVFHGRPSGLDGAVATLGKVCLFRRGAAEDAGQVETLSLLVPPLVVGSSGVSRATATMVAHVCRLREEEPARVEAAFDTIERCLEAGLQAWREGDLWSLGRAMTRNHEVLQGLGVSTPELDALVQAALRAGALGAKMTGGGGGGCVVALAPGHEEDVLRAWQAEGFWTFAMRLQGA